MMLVHVSHNDTERHSHNKWLAAMTSKLLFFKGKRTYMHKHTLQLDTIALYVIHVHIFSLIIKAVFSAAEAGK